jgi:hypothetical protein
MIEELKKLLGDERLARLANMPIVKEGAGIEAHLQQACEGAASVPHALIKAIKSAGGKPTAEDVAALNAAPQAAPAPAADTQKTQILPKRPVPAKRAPTPAAP